MTASISKIKSLLTDHLNDLEFNYNIKSIGIFGSFARGQNTENSDIDLMVEFIQPISMFKFIELEEHLASILGKKVDLVTKSALKETIKERVLQETVYV